MTMRGQLGGPPANDNEKKPLAGGQNRRQVSEVLVAQEQRAYQRRPRGELRQALTALSFHSWLNTEQEQARMVAIKRLLREKAS